ncbi:hypothetical protein J5N97_020718 [Dioscorea zingiberensis]|uniref:Dof zinc finger protein n=1 Tax=Dioscorea zingiberensis TaxID=325984 RepID=A0A9D5CGX8_9LILI|nr:hypothetical protein J5N97_020718 [Dioscorea zingiberensis]
MERRWKPNVELAPNCPRCDSSNTKFCYYNNYSLTQPRYFCKGCRRYWTKGGSLRNVPVGGGCRKNRRGKTVRMASNSMIGRDVNHVHRQPQGPLRPDLALEGMVGNSCNQATAGLLDMSDLNNDGSTIDLALLYNKYLNQPCPKTGESVREFQGEIDEPLSFISASSFIHPMPTDTLSQSSSEPISDTLMSNGSCQGVLMGELNSCLDQIGYINSLPFSVDGVANEVLSSNNCSVDTSFMCQEIIKYQDLDTFISEDNTTAHQEDLINGDWSTFSQTSFEAFYTLL